MIKKVDTNDNNFLKTKIYHLPFTTTYLLPLTSYLLFKKGQSILEYSIVLGVVVMAMIAMGPMIKRGTQSLIKVVADQVGIQQNAEQTFDERGHLEGSNMFSRGSMDKQTFDTAGTISYVFDDMTTTQTISAINLGFTPGQ
jgi:uncharacterized protein (UPF0333 family)